MTTNDHTTRAHSKFSASGAERWMNCPGSVALSEGLPDKSSPWAKEGTEAHEVLEKVLSGNWQPSDAHGVPKEMIDHAFRAAYFINSLAKELPSAELLVETRVYLDFIHPEMFGTFDSAVVDHFGTLHVFDYKYGAGHFVTPGTLEKPNLQMAFYGIGLAARYEFNFKTVRLWIIQPRVKGFEGPLYLDLPTRVIMNMVRLFKVAVERVEKNPNEYIEGGWCHWCKAKNICPLKQEKKLEKARQAFSY